jgi:hypothetical protein
MAGTKHFSRMNYHVLRGMRELLSHRSLTDQEWEQIKLFFENTCAFCGCEDTGNPRTGLVPDHLIPAVEHGENCIGNIVASCQKCNDHRGKKEWRSYLLSEFKDAAPGRIAKIDKYLNLYPYTVSGDPHEYLTEEETGDYSSILGEWDVVWKKACALRDRINKRRKREKI